jgi:hypothetical protein
MSSLVAATSSRSLVTSTAALGTKSPFAAKVRPTKCHEQFEPSRWHQLTRSLSCCALLSYATKSRLSTGSRATLGLRQTLRPADTSV